ncbi:hypothetical protein CR513_06336, partial [Mucuna pruriens]
MMPLVLVSQLNYSTYNRKLYALVRALQTLQYYLFPNEFVIHSDHEALKHFKGKGKLNKRHSKWVEFLEKFPYMIKCKQGKMNVVADALSMRHALISMLKTKMFGLDCIKEFYEKDHDFNEPFTIKRLMLVKETYEGGLISHFGELKTLKILNEDFYWPHMRKDVHNICKRCLACKLAKSRVFPHGLYTPFPIPTSPWIDISMDFILD